MRRRPKPAKPRSRGVTHVTCAAMLVAAFAACAPGDAEAADISLPDLLAVEIPSEGTTAIADSASPMAELLASANAGGLAITHDRAGYLFPVGGTEVVWTAWDGDPYVSNVLATATAYVYVFRHGETPVGVTADDRATAGNHSAKVVRDGSGTIHVAWLDSGRPVAGDRVMYRRGVQDESTGAVTWEADPIRISNGTGESSRSHVAMAASKSAVHFAWYEGTTNWYRRLVRTGAVPAYVWTFEDPVDLAAAGSMSDNGPDICAVSDTEIHVLETSGKYLCSTNGGQDWAAEDVPAPPSGGMKGPSLAIDSQGNVHVVYTHTVRDSKWGSWRTDEPNAGYWEIWYVVRQAGGGWSSGENVLADFLEWADPQTVYVPLDEEYDYDVLADWIDIEIDADDNIHIAWHGSVNTHIFGNDEAFYIRRPAIGPASWGAWQPPQALHPINPSLGHYFSWCPALCVDALSDLALPVAFYNTEAVDDASSLYQSAFRAVRGGVIEGDAVDLSLASEAELSTWFSSVNPRVYQHPGGGAWLDVLQTEKTPASHGSPFIVTYQRHEITALLDYTPGSLTSGDGGGCVPAEGGAYAVHWLAVSLLVLSRRLPGRRSQPPAGRRQGDPGQSRSHPGHRFAP